MLKALPYRPGVVKDDSELASQGYATDCEQIRWVRGRAEALGGWKALNGAIKGAARSAAEFTSADNKPLLAIGTSAALHLWDGDDLFNITPLRSSGTAGANPVATTLGASTVVITIATHGAEVGATVYLRGATSVGGITIGGGSGTLPANPFTVTAGSRKVQVSHTAHGLTTGDAAYFTGATGVGDILAATLNAVSGFRVRSVNANLYEIEVDEPVSSTATGGGTPAYEYAKPYTVAATTVDTITIETGSTATATATGGGSGIEYEFDLNPGAESAGFLGSGFGSGLFGAGFFGVSSDNALVEIRTPPRIWSLAVWGVQLVANVIGDAIYIWTGNRSKRATALANAPAECNGVMVTPERFLLALGCTDGGGEFDSLLIRFPDGLDLTDWTPSATNNAGSIRLGKGSRIVAGRVGQAGPLVWTDTTLYRIRWVGEFDQIYDYDIVGVECGLIAPNATAQTGAGAVYWLSGQYQFFVYAGGQPREVPCPLRRWFEERVAKGQADKIFASNDSRHPAVTWDYQSSSSAADVDSYVRLDIPEQQADPNAGWSHGTRARSAWSSGVTFEAGTPLGISPTGVLYEHDLVYDADGSVIERFVRWAPAEIGDGDTLTTLTRVVVDGVYDVRPTVTLYGRLHPRQDEFSRGPMQVNGKGYIDRVMKARQIGIMLEFVGSTFWRLGVLKGDISSASRR